MTDRRWRKRFALRLPFKITRLGPLQTLRMGETLNMSSCGVLFRIDVLLKRGQQIECTITLPTAQTGNRTVVVNCWGRVVRCDGALAAATLERYRFVRMPRLDDVF